MNRGEVQMFLNKLDYTYARNFAADVAGNIYNGKNPSDLPHYVGGEEEIKTWLMAILSQDLPPDMEWVERFVRMTCGH